MNAISALCAHPRRHEPTLAFPEVRISRAAGVFAFMISVLPPSLQNRLYRSFAYQLTLNGPLPDPIIKAPANIRPGRPEIANAMFQGFYNLPGGRVMTDGRSPFAVTPPGRMWAESLHGFGWLSHFAAAGGEGARAYVRQRMNDWLSGYGRWHPLAWQPHVTGRRLLSWLVHSSFLLDASELVYRSSVIRSMARQARHLVRVAGQAPEGAPRLTAALGMLLSGLCLSEGAKRIPSGLALVTHELHLQILPDGVHISRNPALHLDILLDLIVARDAYIFTGRAVPAVLDDTIERMTAMARFFLHSDDRLAVFRGGGEQTGGAVEAVRPGLSEPATAPAGFAPCAGYQRLQGGKTVVLIETGPREADTGPPGTPPAQLAFEMSTGLDRIIVNCGSSSFFGAEWARAGQTPSAFSTLTLVETPVPRRPSRFSFIAGGGEAGTPPTGILFHQDETGGWADAARAMGTITHRRRLFLTAAGDSLRGQDILTHNSRNAAPLNKGGVLPFVIRFHMHPSCRVSVSRDGLSALIAPGHGPGWRFIARCAEAPLSLTLEDSVYLGQGEGEQIRRTRQIVITGQMQYAQKPGAQLSVKWMVRKLEDVVSDSMNTIPPGLHDEQIELPIPSTPVVTKT